MRELLDFGLEYSAVMVELEAFHSLGSFVFATSPDQDENDVS